MARDDTLVKAAFQVLAQTLDINDFIGTLGHIRT
jgi:hypothetical protein